MQFCRKVLCQPCSARVTSPEEDMEYKMGSCIGISHSQVKRGDRERVNAAEADGRDIFRHDTQQRVCERRC